MDIKEFFLGTPKSVTRRLFIRRAGALTAGVLLGGLALNALTNKNSDKNEDAQYKNLAQYKNKEVTNHVGKDIYLSLAQSPYPSLAVSGKFLLENLDNPNNVTTTEPVFKPNGKSIKLKFEDLGSTVAMFSDRGTLIATEVRLKDASTSKDITFMGLNSESSDLSISLNSTLIDVNASSAVITLMIAKEASHPLYFKDLRAKMISELKDKYEFSEQPQFSDLLVSTAMESKNPRLKVPFLSDMFNNFEEYLNYAGYGHIVLDLAQMRDNGLLNSKDQKILSYNFAGLKLAQNRGLIIKDQDRYKWADGVSPTAKQWFDVMREVHEKGGRIN